MQKTSKALKIAIVVLAVLCGFSLAALGGVLIYHYARPTESTAAVVSNNFISQSSQGSAGGSTVAATAAQGSSTNAQSSSTNAQSSTVAGQPVRLTLHQSSSRVNVPFAAQNLFPGDAIAQSYSVSVSHQKAVTVFFGVSVHQGGQKLAEALCLKVVLVGTGQMLYNGPVAAMPRQLECRLAAAESNRVEDLNYSITAYLPTATGNAYQNLRLAADFNWWVEDAGNLGPAPKTGDFSVAAPCAALFAASAAVLLLLLALRRKGRSKNEAE